MDPELINSIGDAFFTIGTPLLILSPLVPWITALKNNNEKIVDEVPEVQGLEEIADQLTSLDFVNLASGIVHEKAQPRHRCRHFSRDTLTTYLQLVDAYGRSNLKKHIREVHASGVPGNGTGHVFLEVIVDGKWCSYESSDPTPLFYDATMVQDYSTYSFDEKSQIAGERDKHVIFRSLPGSVVPYPTPKGFVFGSLAVRLYQIFIVGKSGSD